MIVSAHQPNFLPYMGYFYKLYRSDIFVISDSVMFSKSGYHHYNFFNENGSRKKITVPVSGKSGYIDEVELSNWEYNRVKIIKRLKGYYAKSKHYDEIMPVFEKTLSKDYKYLIDLNLALISDVCRLFGILPEIKYERLLKITGDTPTQQIVDICHKTRCNTYLSGDGAVDYLDTEYLKANGIKTVFTNYKPLQYGSLENLSVFDYLMNEGAVVPKEWKAERMVKTLGI